LLWFSCLFTSWTRSSRYTMSLHDALPICRAEHVRLQRGERVVVAPAHQGLRGEMEDEVRLRLAQRPAQVRKVADVALDVTRRVTDWKSTRLNYSQVSISYVDLC